MFDVRAALQATVLLFVEMKFIWTISTFFKEEYEHGKGYMIPYHLYWNIIEIINKEFIIIVVMGHVLTTRTALDINF